ncbi:MAG: hypothetical protein HC849_06505 [Oscillatoriales cyanobacterium RU_3_3]|nr:hypothetical protein [Oscillatoriales cyanobacterium RU_3_3]NJR22395.1 hypothetical protein [Richelia sp. CSU_2_1]
MCFKLTILFQLAEATNKLRLHELSFFSFIDRILAAGTGSQPGCFPKLGCIAKAIASEERP